MSYASCTTASLTRAPSTGEKSSSQEMPFIVSGDNKKVNEKTQKFIRSHVMLGKNKGKSKPRTKKQQNAAAAGRSSDVVVAARWVHFEPPPSALPVASASVDPAAPPVAAAEPVELYQVIPQRVGSDLSFLRLAEPLEPCTIKAVLTFCTSAKNVLYPLEPCIRFDRDVITWVEPMKFDPVFLHGLVFSTQAFCNMGQAIEAWKMPSFSKMLKLLRHRLSCEDSQTQISIGTITAVLFLTWHAFMLGEHEMALHHLKGLRRMITLRGGLMAIKDSAIKLSVEILRTDIGMTLRCGLPPLFFQTHSLEPMRPLPDLSFSFPPSTATRLNPTSHKQHFPNVSFSLVLVWDTLKRFSALINGAATTSQQYPTGFLLEMMASVMYRLLNTRFEVGSMDEMIRLSLLALSASLFLPWQNIRVSYFHLSASYKECLIQLDHGKAPPQLLLWIVEVGAISVFDAGEDGWVIPLLRKSIDECGVRGWDDMWDTLHKFLWVDLVHNRGGKGAFDSAMALQ